MSDMQVINWFDTAKKKIKAKGWDVKVYTDSFALRDNSRSDAPYSIHFLTVEALYNYMCGYANGFSDGKAKGIKSCQTIKKKLSK